MELTPDENIIFTLQGISITATVVNTWLIMALLTGVSMLITRNLRPDVPPNRWRTMLEVIVNGIVGQIAEITERRDPRILYFVGTLFLFILSLAFSLFGDALRDALDPKLRT